MKRFYLSVLGDCNQHCIFCARIATFEKIQYISFEKIKKILKEKSSQGFDELYLDGGEPTLRDDLYRIIEEAKRAGFLSVCVLTNAVRLSQPQIVAQIAKRKINIAGFKLTFSISLHSHKRSVSDFLVGVPGSFDKTVSGIDNLIKANFKGLSLYHLINKYNYKDLPKFVEFVKNRFEEIGNITFSFIYPAGLSSKFIDIYPRLSGVKPYFLKALRLCKLHGISYSISTCGSIPLCFMTGYEDLLIRRQDLDQPENVGIFDSGQDAGFQLSTKEFHEQSKIKSESCADCQLNDKCAGIWSIYANKYGLQELKPIKKTNVRPVERTLVLLTGQSCNNNCVFCSLDRGKNSYRSTSAIIEDIRNGFKRGYRAVEFIGGESSIRDDFLELISFARSVGYKRIMLTTNGRIFSYTSFVDKVSDAGIDRITFSLYGHESRMHDGVTRVKGSFEQTVKGIKNCIEKGLDISVNTVVSRLNYRHIAQIGKFINKMGVKEWYILELLPDGKGKQAYDRYSVSLKDLNIELNKVKSIAGFFRKIFFVDFPLCIFSKDMFLTEQIGFIGPMLRYQEIVQRGSDELPTRIRIKKIGTKVVYEDKYKLKITKCKDCRHAYSCGGINKQYVKKHGYGEIQELLDINN